MNESEIASGILNFSNFTTPKFDCGVMVTNFAEKVDFNVKLVSIVLVFLIIFEWWALNKINTGDLTHERKRLLIAFVLIFIHALILFGAFYLMYWAVLARIDF